MKPSDDTIAYVAWKFLRDEKKAMDLNDILAGILSRKLYTFNTTDPKSVLREQVRRHCAGLDKELAYNPVLFRTKGDGLYEATMNNQPNHRITQTRRIQRATDKEETIKLLTQGAQAPFKEIWSLMLFAAMLGYKEGCREKMSAVDTGKGIDVRYFSNSPAWPGLVYLLSLVVTREAEALTGEQDKEEARLVIFEEYANGGLSVLRDKLESSGYSLDSLCQLVATYSGSIERGENTLSQITI